MTGQNNADVNNTEIKSQIANRYLGRGYKGWEYYARARSVTLPLFDFSDSSKFENYIDFVDTPSYSNQFIRGKSEKNYFNNLSASVGLKFPYEGFAFEVNSSFNWTTDSTTTREYFNYSECINRYRLTLKRKPPLLAEVKEDFIKLSANQLFDKYGTHYLSSVLIGGRISFLSHIDTSKLTDIQKVHLDGSIKAAATESIKSESTASVTNDNKSVVDEAKTNRIMSVEGGDPLKAAPIIDKSTGEIAKAYDEWANTLNQPQYLSISDFVSDGLRPIFELAVDADAPIDRQKELEKEWGTYLKKRTGTIVDAVPPQPVMKSDSIKLAAQDGRYLSYSKSGMSYYFARLAPDSVLHNLGGANECLVDGSNVNLITTEPFKDNFWGDWSKRTWLGAFATDRELYYWNSYGSKTNWIFERVDTSTGREIHYGDEVYIKNEEYDQYLVPYKDGYVTTRKGEKYKWIIKK